MEQELAKTSGSMAIRSGLHAIATSLAHLWIWNLTTQSIEFYIRFSSIGMREDIPATRGKRIRISCMIENVESERNNG